MADSTEDTSKTREPFAWLYLIDFNEFILAERVGFGPGERESPALLHERPGDAGVVGAEHPAV